MTETERIDNIVEDLTQSAAADALLGACSACSHPSCERKRQAERDTQIAGQELAAYIATLRAQLAVVREEMAQLQRFVGLVMHESRDGDDMDGGTVQSIAEKCGILNAVQVTQSCAGEDGYCACAEYGFPTECYQFTTLGRACQSAALDGAA